MELYNFFNGFAMACLTQFIVVSLKRYSFIGPIFILWVLTQPVFASNKAAEIYDFSLKELMSLRIISAGKRDEKISDIPASVTIITRKDIENYGYTTLVDILENTPGLYNINNYFYAPGNFGTRGSWNPGGQNASFAVLVNGVSQLREDDRSNPLDKIAVPVEAIDRIEFIRGPMSVLYGNGASFGVINIITNDIETSLISYGEGDQNSRKKFARVAKHWHTGSVTLNVSDYSTDGPDYKFTDMVSGSQLPGMLALIPDENFSTEDRLELANNYVQLTGDFKGFYYDLSQNETDSEFYLLAPALDEGTIRKTESETIQLGYKSTLSNNLKIDIKATQSNYSHDTIFEGILPGKTGENSLEYKYKSAEIIGEYNQDSTFDLVIGLNYNKLYDHEEFTHAPLGSFFHEFFFLEDRKTYSAYTNASFHLGKEWTLQVGYRYERLPSYESYGFNDTDTFRTKRGDITNETPRLALIYNFENNHTLKLLYGEASRIDLDRFEPEIIKTYELNHLYFSENILINTSIFYNEISNILVTERNLSGSFPKLPIGEIETTGIETIINYTITDSLSSEISATFQDSENPNQSSIDVPYSPRWVAQAKLSYEFNRSVFSINAKFVDSIKPFYSFEDQARIGNKIDSYTVVDMNMRVNDLYKDLYLNIKASNIFDEEIRYPNNPENNGTSALNNAMNEGTIGDERAFFVTVGWRFQ